MSRIQLSRNATENERDIVLAVAVVALASANLALVWLAWIIEYQKAEIKALVKLLGW